MYINLHTWACWFSMPLGRPQSKLHSLTLAKSAWNPPRGCPLNYVILHDSTKIGPSIIPQLRSNTLLLALPLRLIAQHLNIAWWKAGGKSPPTPRGDKADLNRSQGKHQTEASLCYINLYLVIIISIWSYWLQATYYTWSRENEVSHVLSILRLSNFKFL